MGVRLLDGVEPPELTIAAAMASSPYAIDATMVPLLPLLDGVTGRCPRRSTSAKHATKLLEEGG